MRWKTIVVNFLEFLVFRLMSSKNRVQFAISIGIYWAPTLSSQIRTAHELNNRSPILTGLNGPQVVFPPFALVRLVKLSNLAVYFGLENLVKSCLRKNYGLRWMVFIWIWEQKATFELYMLLPFLCPLSFFILCYVSDTAEFVHRFAQFMFTSVGMVFSIFYLSYRPFLLSRPVLYQNNT